MMKSCWLEKNRKIEENVTKRVRNLFRLKKLKKNKMILQLKI